MSPGHRCMSMAAWRCCDAGVSGSGGSGIAGGGGVNVLVHGDLGAGSVVLSGIINDGSVCWYGFGAFHQRLFAIWVAGWVWVFVRAGFNGDGVCVLAIGRVFIVALGQDEEQPVFHWLCSGFSGSFVSLDVLQPGYFGNLKWPVSGRLAEVFVAAGVEFCRHRADILSVPNWRTT